ncbi:NAD-dependent epimerase/dehydratase family protein [Tenacibaculum xiamenense]|uniref:NAD-dependent epimerase/dehydratase family protein n=1 Tax=Tenacibaculum xiamenense TaxID=1261553 RepID=UPI003895F76B
MYKILVTGACGQLGSVLVKRLRSKHGEHNVIASDIRSKPDIEELFIKLDVTDSNALEKVITKYQIKEIYHLAAILSAKGEESPLKTWDINIKSLLNVLEVSRLKNVKKVFYPSSIAVFGDHIDRNYTSQISCLSPKTVYGISKVAGENWCQYYFDNYGLDVRSIRYPGIIGYQSLPGGGTTDYAIDIFYKAIEGVEFKCFLSENTSLPMMFIDDAIRATIELMRAPKELIKTRSSYNISGISFSPAQIVESIKKLLPDFKITYKPDFRQGIAENWPSSINDSEARGDWGWNSKFNLDDITEIMIAELTKKNKIKTHNV